MSDKATIEQKINGITKELQAKLGDRNFSFKDQNNLIRKLGEMNTWQVIKPFEEILNHKNSTDNVKKRILEELGKIGDPRVIKVLTKYVNDTNKIIKNAAVKGLSRIKHPKCVQPLLNSINDTDKWIRIFSIHGLARNPSKKIVWPILERLGDDEKEVREEARIILEKMKADLLTDSVIKGLKHSNRFVKIGSAALIGEKKIIPALRGLLKVLNTDDKRLAIVAARSLSKMEDPNGIPKLLMKAIKENGIGSIYASSIINMGRIAIEPLVRLYLLAQNKQDILDLIIQILKKLGDEVPSIILTVKNELESNDKIEILEDLYNKF